MGNISYKSDVGQYSYGQDPVTNHPYCLLSINNKPVTISEKTQNISYTSFNKVKEISGSTSSDLALQILYGVDHNRMKQVVMRGNDPICSKVYFNGNYEKIIDNQGSREVHYIVGGDGLAAIIIKHSDGSFEFNYTHKDHLGSIQYITDEIGNVKEELSYDPWGAQRDPSTWTVYDNPPQSNITDAGYTGHEQLNLFSLINMTGRVYDPVIGRFVSVDPIFLKNDNRDGINAYFYCRNNPLSNVDPDGNCPALLAIALLSAAWTAITNMLSTPGHLTWSSAFASYNVGAIAGFVGTYTGGAVMGAFGGGLFAGMLSSSLTYSLTVGITTYGNNAFLGTGIMDGNDFLVGLGTAALSGAIVGAIEADMTPEEQASPATSKEPLETTRAELNDKELQNQASTQLNMREGHNGLRKLTTAAPMNDGYNRDGIIDKNGMINVKVDGKFQAVNGVTRKVKGAVYWGARSDVYISPHITKFPKWTTGTLLHENIHVIQNFSGYYLNHTLPEMENGAYRIEMNYYMRQLELRPDDVLLDRYLRWTINGYLREVLGW